MKLNENERIWMILSLFTVPWGFTSDEGWEYDNSNKIQFNFGLISRIENGGTTILGLILHLQKG